MPPRLADPMAERASAAPLSSAADGEDQRGACDKQRHSSDDGREQIPANPSQSTSRHCRRRVRV